MSDFQTVARVGEIPAGEGRCFALDDKLVAVFLVDEEYFAINDTCPHMGASLAEGYVEEGAVYCPWHAWRFSVRDGTWLDNPKASLKTDSYPVRVSGDEIQVALPDPIAADESLKQGDSPA
jgi:nitrite reductase (NADH) small subunit/3-phenylpropionate/trans-cinnamate dioxygenase ferredoxin subunit